MTFTHAVLDSRNNKILCHSPNEAAAAAFIKSSDARSATLHVVSLAEAELFNKWTPYVTMIIKGQTATIAKDGSSPGYFDFVWKEARKKRDRLLSASDWTQLPDSPLSATQKKAWTTYRQTLRDITQQTDPEKVVWPVAP